MYEDESGRSIRDDDADSARKVQETLTPEIDTPQKF